MNVEIEAILPHRAPFLWVDRVLEIEPGTRCVAVKDVDPAAPFFAGHFPGDPILPGVFLVEAAAQTAGIMLGAPRAAEAGSPDAARGSEKRLGSIEQFKLLRPVRPGARLRIETRTLVEREGLALVSAVITVEGEVVARGQLAVSSR